MLSFAIDDATLGQVVRRQFHPHFVARDNSDEVLAHASSDMCHDLGPGLQLHAESSIGQRLCDGAFDLEGLFFISQNLTSNQENVCRKIVLTQRPKVNDVLTTYERVGIGAADWMIEHLLQRRSSSRHSI